MSEVLKRFCLHNGKTWFCLSGGEAPPDEYAIDWDYATVYCQRDSDGKNTSLQLQYASGISVKKNGTAVPESPYSILANFNGSGGAVTGVAYQQLSAANQQTRATALRAYVLSVIAPEATVVDNTTGVDPNKTNATACAYTAPTFTFPVEFTLSVPSAWDPWNPDIYIGLELTLETGGKTVSILQGNKTSSAMMLVDPGTADPGAGLKTSHVENATFDPAISGTVTIKYTLPFSWFWIMGSGPNMPAIQYKLTLAISYKGSTLGTNSFTIPQMEWGFGGEGSYTGSFQWTPTDSTSKLIFAITAV
jgi:hypothetical protein